MSASSAVKPRTASGARKTAVINNPTTTHVRQRAARPVKDIAEGHALINNNMARVLRPSKPAYFGLADGLNDGKETVGAFSAPAALVKYAFGVNPISPAYSTVGKDLTMTL